MIENPERELATLDQVTSPEAIEAVLQKLGFGKQQFQDEITGSVKNLLEIYKEKRAVLHYPYDKVFQIIIKALDEVFPYPQLNDGDATLKVAGVHAVMQRVIDAVWEKDYSELPLVKPDIEQSYKNATYKRQTHDLLHTGRQPQGYQLKNHLNKVVCLPEAHLDNIYHNEFSRGYRDVCKPEVLFCFSSEDQCLAFQQNISNARNELQLPPAESLENVYKHLDQALTQKFDSPSNVFSVLYRLEDVGYGVLEHAGYQPLPVDGRTLKEDSEITTRFCSGEEIVAKIKKQLAAIALERVGVTPQLVGRVVG